MLDITVYPQSFTDVLGSKFVNSSLMSKPYFNTPLVLLLEAAPAP